MRRWVLLAAVVVLVLAMAGGAEADIWQSDSGIVNGLGDVGGYSSPTYFQNGGTAYLISGETDGIFHGYNWTGSTWQSDSGIVNGLGDVGSLSAPTYFEKDGTAYLISGNSVGIFHGYNWTGSTWQSDSGIVNGLGDVGMCSYPTYFEKYGTAYLISGETDGIFNGYKWTGSTWQSDSGIVNGLGDVGSLSAPTYFEKDGTAYLISGNSVGIFHGYKWTGSTWQSDSGIVNGFGDVGELSRPDVFNISGVLYLISGETDGVFNGYNWQSGVIDAWWVHDWDYRQRIVINNTHATDLNIYYVEVCLNTSQCYWSDCSDMRCVDPTTGWEIDFYCDADIGGFPDTTATEKIYLEVPYIAGNGSAYIDFYFGNINSVPNKCTGSGTLSFTETFGDGDGYLNRWYPAGNGYCEIMPDHVWRGNDYSAWIYTPSGKPPCATTNFLMRYGYYGDRYTLVQPDGAEISFIYSTSYDDIARSYLLFGCPDDLTYYESLTTVTDSYTLPSTAKMNFQVPSYTSLSIDDGLNVYIDNIRLIQNDLYMPPHAVGAVEMRPQPYIAIYDSSKNLVQHAQVSIQNLTTAETAQPWEDVADGIIDMGTSTDTFQVAVRTFDGVFVHTCDLGANPVCEIVLPIHYNLRVYPVDEQQKPLTDVFAGLAEYTPLDPQAFWGYSMTGSQYVPVTNCSGFAMCDLIAEKGGYVPYNVTALNWTTKSALVKDYRHTATLIKE